MIDADGLAVEGLGYGNFLSYRAPGTFVSVKRGNGIEVYARTPKKFNVRLRDEVVNAVVNDVPVNPRKRDGWRHVAIPKWKKPETDLIAELRAATSADSDTLIPLLNRIRAAMLCEAAPLVRDLLKWNGSTITGPGNPLATESSHVRMEAARTLACLGDSESVDALIALIDMEQATVYSPDSKWSTQFLGSSARVVAIEALIFLHAAKFLPMIDRIRSKEGVPHAQDGLGRAREILSTPW
jgi:HEAT repeat protein